MAQISLESAPRRLLKGAGRYPQPVALLARLAVDRHHEHQGIGAGLLRDVISRLILVGDEIGCRGLLIHAESDAAREFYTNLIPELIESPTDSLHLVLLLKDALRTLRST
jgi:GNAT superfamily N-acetyltransferase